MTGLFGKERPNSAFRIRRTEACGKIALLQQCTTGHSAADHHNISITRQLAVAVQGTWNSVSHRWSSAFGTIADLNAPALAGANLSTNAASISDAYDGLSLDG